MMNSKVYFFCKDTHDKTRFYHYISDLTIEDYENDQDQLLLDDGLIDELQNLSTHGMLDNWGVIDIDECADEVSSIFNKAVSDDKFLDDDAKYKFLDEAEKITARTNKNLKKAKAKLKLYNDAKSLKNLSKSELINLYDELTKKLKDIADTVKAKENGEEKEKREWMRDQLLKNTMMVSTSGWIDRTGKWWNVQPVDHDQVAILKWGSMANAEKNNIRVSDTGWDINVLFSAQATRPPNNKQMRTLYKWGETFNTQGFVKQFEKSLKTIFYND